MDLTALYQNYTKKQVDEAVAYLSYHDVKPLPKDENPSYPILYVFRHGQTTDNADFLFSGWRDPELTELGVHQATILAEKLKAKKLHMLVASDQRRAIKTMELAVALNAAAKALEIHTDARLKERSYGDLQGTSKLEMQLTNPAHLAEERRSYDFIPPNGESTAMVVQRVKRFIEEIVPLMQMYHMNVAVSCHGNSIRGFRQVFEGLTNDQTALVESPLGQDYAAYSIK
jgi:2,3-bisphosphoglycerate-dependent phosphoglycerate mutase